MIREGRGEKKGIAGRGRGIFPVVAHVVVWIILVILFIRHEECGLIHFI